MEVKITTENFEKYKNGELPLVVDLWATWCGPCRMVGPIISELAEEYDGKLVVGKCDVEEDSEMLKIARGHESEFVIASEAGVKSRACGVWPEAFAYAY